MRKDPYVYDDTNVLKNLANIKEQHKLDDYETTMVNLGIIKLLKSDIEIVKVEEIQVLREDVKFEYNTFNNVDDLLKSLKDDSKE